jgi:hypothetical protein
LPVDRILRNLDTGNLVFNAPSSMAVGEATVIHLVLSPSLTIEALLDSMAAAEGELESARVRIASRMAAHLSSSGFAITTITPELQAVSWDEVTEWKWEITAIATGRQRLHLSLTVVVDLAGSATPRAIRTFEKVIEVQVTFTRRAASFIGSNLEWL